MTVLFEKKLSSKIVYKGRVIDLRVDEVELPNGKKGQREVVEYNGAVAVVALDRNREVLMVRQFRYAVGEVLLEIPAGKINQGEDPGLAARRELGEETGHEAGEWRLLTAFYSTPGFTTERLYIYLAGGLKPGEQHTDEDEFIQVESYPLEKALSLIDKGEIKDAKTMVGLLAAKRYFDRNK